ncbi:MAG: ribbon-helix-helix protein, CopG family [Mariprofundus sp.]|nr:ribbon-helix-helix protein, CopG family [Mariprofundus sp.]
MMTIMRTIVDIPEQNIQALDAICSREHISRAEAVRMAVADYLKRHGSRPDTAFGLWQGRGKDGLCYQDDLREEWNPSTLHEPSAE